MWTLSLPRCAPSLLIPNLFLKFTRRRAHWTTYRVTSSLWRAPRTMRTCMWTLSSLRCAASPFMIESMRDSAPETLQRNSVPVAGATPYEDISVDSELAQVCGLPAC